MILGLKRGIVELADHDPQWKNAAADMIEQLWCIFGVKANDIQHIGSTAIAGIKAKPIIDIAVGIHSFESLDALLPHLEVNGIEKSAGQPFENVVLFSVDDCKSGKRIYNISVVKFDNNQWRNYINFRDYMNNFPNKAIAYDD